MPVFIYQPERNAHKLEKGKRLHYLIEQQFAEGFDWNIERVFVEILRIRNLLFR